MKESPLVEAARVVLASLVATCFAGAILAPWVWLPLYDVAQESSFSRAVDAVPYMAGVLATSICSCALVLIATSLLWRERGKIKQLRVWHRAFEEWVPRDSPQRRPYVIVELLDGTVWRGTIIAFDSDPEDSQRGIALGAPLQRKRENDNTFTDRQSIWHTVIVPETQIKTIQVSYPKV